ncbi:hypothetical protein [Lentimicrobium sp. S6]|nr:hypothetical protein [Lentimicrobium sp. S6]NPD44519.1 hypothetical protein [Lentimicrobium sp. S6]
MFNVKTFIALFMAFCISQIGISQEKYAVLITGDYVAQGIPNTHQFNGG